MNVRKPILPLLYRHGTPLTWLRKAVSEVDESIATLMAERWRRVPVSAVRSAYGCGETSVR
jgi:hypothetical protein